MGEITVAGTVPTPIDVVKTVVVITVADKSMAAVIASTFFNHRTTGV